MKEAGGSVNHLAPPVQGRYDDGSRSSLAIIAGRFGSKRNTPSHQPKASYESTTRLVRDKNGGVIMSEPVEMLDIGEKTPVHRKPVPRSTLLAPQEEKEIADEKDRSRSSGWSKYFATSGPSGPDGLSHLPAVYGKPQTVSGSNYGSGSEYSNSRIPSQLSRLPSSVLVPPLDLDFSKHQFDGQRLSQVTSGSPSFSDSREDLARRGSTTDLTEGQKGLIVDPRLDRRSQISGHSLSSYKRTTMSSNITSTSDLYNDSGATPWTPVSPSFKDHVNDSRPSSSNYTNSVIEPRVPSRGKSAGFFPGSGTSYRPAARSRMGSGLKSSTNNTGAVGSGTQALPTIPDLKISKPAEDRDSTMTVFPRGVPSAYYANRENDGTRSPPPAAQRSNQKAMISDMSWLNLGLGGNQNKI